MAISISVLLLSAVNGTILVNIEQAKAGKVPPKPDTTPPKISISSPENNTISKQNYLVLNFNVTAPAGPTVMNPYLGEIYYKTDWHQNNVTVYEHPGYPTYPDDDFSSETWMTLRPKTNNLNLTEIPDGNHSITIFASYIGAYPAGPYPVDTNWFLISSSSSVNFTIDTVPPTISILAMENKTYSASDVPLSFAVNEPDSQTSYSLDGQDNMTIAGNTTLTGLPNGDHNVTIYAIDEAGNTGVSEIIYFTVDVPEPFPTAFVMASIITVAVVGVGLLIYFKKRKH